MPGWGVPWFGVFGSTAPWSIMVRALESATPWSILVRTLPKISGGTHRMFLSESIKVIESFYT
ncbi:hypothetical protein C1C98_29030 [Pseudomonas ogarae]|uniref:Uncharacterized protein n=1 Tax=Pseudomonas ogarae (strain DSM 112162 / CECT 30235 / F113) TaxID=1114970 RepID=A0ABN5GE83_PSEO1|nr:hypothetical protein C1C98_29030 [Pseudomonas ogarae]